MMQVKLAEVLLVVGALCAPNFVSSSRVVRFGPKLATMVKENPNKGWLIEFFAPWCHHCQRFEPTFNNIAEKIYHRHDDLIVGAVDCSEHESTCRDFGVTAYPEFKYLKGSTQVTYKATEKSESALVSFAERLHGPSINAAHDCDHLKQVTDLHNAVILNTLQDVRGEQFKLIESVASKLKSTHWFYHTRETCPSIGIEPNGVYLLKKHLNKAIKFDKRFGNSTELATKLSRWLVKHSFPVYGEMASHNYDAAFKYFDILVVALLEEYKPAKKLTRTSAELSKSFERLAVKYANTEGNQLLFAWSSDLHLFESIKVGRIQAPNVMLLKSDLSYHLLIDQEPADPIQEPNRSAKLSERNIRQTITVAKLDELQFYRNNFILRYSYNVWTKTEELYTAQPLLTLVLLGMPLCILTFVLVTTCCYSDASIDDGDFEGDYDNDGDIAHERQRLLANGHRKQD